MSITRYSFGTQSPDRDALGDWVRYKDVQELVDALRDLADAIDEAGWHREFTMTARAAIAAAEGQS